MTQLQKESLDQTSVPYTKYLFIILALIGGVYLLAGPLQNFVTATVDIGVVQAFTCGTSQVQDADGNSYDTVLIGTQCWMAQNLNVGTRVDVSTTQSDNATIEKWCYSDTDANCDTNNNPNYPDGGLYQWDEAMQYSTTEGAQGICPAGWHIPSDSEWYTLENYLATGSCFPSRTGYDCDPAGTLLKPNGSSGFEGNLVGYGTAGSFYNRGSYGFFWSSSESGTGAWSRYLDSGSAQVARTTNGQSFGFSVRCLKDDPRTVPGKVTIATTPVIDELEQGLVGHWTFDGPDVDWGSTTAEIKDKSGNGNHGDAQGAMMTATNAPVAGVLGQALHFRQVSPNDATQGTCINVASDSSIDTLSTMTVVTWVRPDRDNVGDWNSLVGKYLDWNFLFDGGGAGRPSFTVSFDGDDLSVQGDTSIENRKDEWIHLAVTWTGDTATSSVTFYADGVQIPLRAGGQVAGSGSREYGADLKIGNPPWASCGTQTTDSFPGDMDDVRIYNRALSADEVMRLYKLGEGTKIATTVKSPGSPLEQGLVGHWTFDGPDTRWQNTTAEIRDVSGQGNHGDAQGGMGVNSPVMGVIGQGMGFDGVDDEIVVPDDDVYSFTDGGGNDQPFSLAVWARASGLGYLLAKGDGDDEEWRLAINPVAGGGELYFTLADGTNSSIDIEIVSTSSIDILPDEWVHVVAVYDGSEETSGVSFYANGSPLGIWVADKAAYVGMDNDPAPVTVGSQEGTFFIPGSLDDVRIYNRALSAQEVQMLYQLGR